MPRRKRAALGPAAPYSASTGLTFPEALLYPPQPQIAQHSNAITDRVTQLDLHAQHLGEQFGIPFSNFVLNAPPAPTPNNVLLPIMAAMLVREERVTLERRNGKWGLFFTRAAALIGGHDQRVDTVSIRETPLDIREKFLLKSEEFFRAYLTTCEDRLGSMRVAENAGDRTLALLQNVTLREGGPV